MAKLDTIQVGGTDYEVCGAMAFTVSLTAAGWSNNAQTVSNSAFKASGYSYTVTPAYASLAAWKDADISVEDISTNGSCVFHCESVPTSAITVNVTRTVV